MEKKNVITYQSKTIFGLDIVRAIAIILVLVEYAFLILFLFTINKKSAFYTTTFILLSIAILYRISLLSISWDDFNFNSQMVVLSRLDAIMFGGLIVYIKHYHVPLWTKLIQLFPLWLVLTSILVI